MIFDNRDETIWAIPYCDGRDVLTLVRVLDVMLVNKSDFKFVCSIAGGITTVCNKSQKNPACFLIYRHDLCAVTVVILRNKELWVSNICYLFPEKVIVINEMLQS